MGELPAEPSLDGIQKAQIEEWLRQTDKMIRSGRYTSADDLLQKVFAIHPENEVANSYSDRIGFLVKQLSHRVGLTRDVQTEIRKYKDLEVQRSKNKLNAYLVTAHKMFEDGYFKKASELANKALALDSENSYAKALIQRIAELKKDEKESVENVEVEHQFRSLLRESWRKGSPSQSQRTILDDMRQKFFISESRQTDLEREGKNTLYKNALHEIWNTGGLAAFNMEKVEELRKTFDIARTDHSIIETSLLREVRKNKVKGTVLIVDEDEDSLVDLATHLRTNAYAVISAGTIEEALATLKSVKPDVVISEVNFKTGPHGFELFETIRGTPATAHVPFLFMTSTMDRTTLVISKRLGVDEVLTKPLDYEMLFAIMTGKLLRKDKKDKHTYRL